MSAVGQAGSVCFDNGYLGDDELSSEEESVVKIREVAVQTIHDEALIMALSQRMKADNIFVRKKRDYLLNCASKRRKERDFWVKNRQALEIKKILGTWAPMEQSESNACLSPPLYC